MTFRSMKTRGPDSTQISANIDGYPGSPPRPVAEFKRSSSWQDFFSSSIEPAGVLAMVRRVVSGKAPAIAGPRNSGIPNEQDPLPEVKKQLFITVRDCGHDNVRQRIASRIEAAESMTDLWLLRCDIYQCVAREKGQGEASLRINGLLPLFEGWIPARQLSPV